MISLSSEFNLAKEAARIAPERVSQAYRLKTKPW
jgi:hypothetical protein